MSRTRQSRQIDAKHETDPLDGSSINKIRDGAHKVPPETHTLVVAIPPRGSNNPRPVPGTRSASDNCADE